MANNAAADATNLSARQLVRLLALQSARQSAQLQVSMTHGEDAAKGILAGSCELEQQPTWSGHEITCEEIRFRTQAGLAGTL